MGRIASIEFDKIKKPLKITFSTAMGEKKYLQSLILRVTLDTKHNGIGECPTSRSYPEGSLTSMEHFLKGIIPFFLGRDIREYPSLVEKLKKENPAYVLTLSGIEVALFRAYLSYYGLSEFYFWGGKSKTIETDITVPNVERTRALEWATFFLRKKFRFFKIKLKGFLDEDIEFLSGVYETLKRRTTEDFWIGLDMNGSYTVRNFFSFTEKLRNLKIPVQFVEQPLKRGDYAGLRQILGKSDLEIILDESVITLEDLDRLGEIGFKGGVNVKIAKSGISESKKIHDRAKKHGLKLMIGCMTETSVGLSAGIYFALGHGDFDYVDLDGIHFIKGREKINSVKISGPRYVLGNS
ncbi:MAG: hypothetical protein N2513_00520 [Deltaproteobacteria bacterium]|nr:hypothetical protein [Deltaproteobacteria bacterium]